MRTAKPGGNAVVEGDAPRQRAAAAEAEAPIKMKGDGSEPEDISFV